MEYIHISKLTPNESRIAVVKMLFVVVFPLWQRFCSPLSSQILQPAGDFAASSYSSAAGQGGVRARTTLWLPFPSGRASHLLSPYSCQTFTGNLLTAFLPFTIYLHLSNVLLTFHHLTSFVCSLFCLSPFILIC